MNTQLEKLFEAYEFSAKDRYDFLQIYRLLPDIKRVKALDNFEEIATQMQTLREQLHTEQEILFGQTLEHIESRLQRMQKEKILGGSKSHIALLRQSF